MNHGNRTDRTRTYLLGAVLLIGIVIALAVPGSLSYVLVALAIVLHFGMHGTHGRSTPGHGGHGAERRGGHVQAGAQGASRPEQAPGDDRTLRGGRSQPTHAPHPAPTTLVAATSARAAAELPAGSTGDDSSTEPRRHHGHGGGGHRCC